MPLMLCAAVRTPGVPTLQTTTTPPVPALEASASCRPGGGGGGHWGLYGPHAHTYACHACMLHIKWSSLHAPNVVTRTAVDCPKATCAEHPKQLYLAGGLHRVVLMHGSLKAHNRVLHLLAYR